MTSLMRSFKADGKAVNLAGITKRMTSRVDGRWVIMDGKWSERQLITAIRNMKAPAQPPAP